MPKDTSSFFFTITLPLPTIQNNISKFELQDSILNAFAAKKIRNYWFESGTPTYLIHQLQRFGTDVTTLDEIEATEAMFDRPSEVLDNALPLLYQSGYLTIKNYDQDFGSYILGIPNKEVRVGLTEHLLPKWQIEE